jgi:hypothetical protein
MTFIRWTLTDLEDDSVYTFPINPNQMASLFVSKQLTTYPGSDGPRTTRTHSEPFEWTFGGHSRGKPMHDDLLSWVNRKHQLRVGDHIGRTFVILPTRIEFTDRRSWVEPWRFTYEVRSLMMSEMGGVGLR